MDNLEDFTKYGDILNKGKKLLDLCITEQNVINKIMPFFTQYYSVKWENYPVHDHYVSNPIRIDVKR